MRRVTKKHWKHDIDRTEDPPVIPPRERPKFKPPRYDLRKIPMTEDEEDLHDEKIERKRDRDRDR